MSMNLNLLRTFFLWSLSPRVTKILYITGTMIMVIRVEKINPPITEMPMGLHISDPSPVLSARGSMPRIVVKAVINTGRSLDLPDNMMASSRS